MNPKQECKKLINSFKYAIEGFVSSFKTERNMKIHILAMIIVIVLGLYLKLSLVEWCIISLAIALVIGAELFNTAIETIVDYYIKLRGGKDSPTKEFFEVPVGISFQEFNKYINHV